jgi:site-specific recombinase XerD
LILWQFCVTLFGGIEEGRTQMATKPVVVTIYVRHGTDAQGKPCKYSGDEFEKRCRCRKHFRWTVNGKRFRRKAGTRSWTEAEVIKRALEDQLSGRALDSDETSVRDLRESIDLFLQDKRVQGVTPGVLEKYTRELARLRDYCEGKGVFIVSGLTRELLTGFCATWDGLYHSTQTRSSVRARCRAFLRFCYEAQWLPRIPALPKIRVDEVPTLPLTAGEYTSLLRAVSVVHADPKRRTRVRALFQLMRWSGLAIGDALTLERGEIRHDKGNGLYRVVTARQKTGTPVSVPIPPRVAGEILAATNDNPRYLFWDGETDRDNLTKSWRKYFIAPVFESAKIARGGSMMSHRLRDTFAVDLLEKGVPLEEVSKLLGHESIKTTEKSYAKWVKARQDRLDSLVTATWHK